MTGVVAGAGCGAGDATLGSSCQQDADCGSAQVCDNEVCGRCGDGLAQPGEVCLRQGPVFDLGRTPLWVRAADLGRDGVVDLVALAPGTAELVVLRGEPGGFGPPEPVALSGPATSLAVGDLDGDGTVDAVVADAETIRFGSGAGALVFSFGPQHLTWAGATALRFAVGTADTAPFVVASRATADASTEVVALHVAPDGVLRIGAGVTVPGGLVPAAAGELFGGGPPEMLLVGDRMVHVWSGPELVALTSVPVAAEITAVAVADVDGDGANEILTADVEGTVVIHAADGRGGFRIRESLSMPGAQRALVVGDLDRDGSRDIVAASAAYGVTAALARTAGHAEPITLPGPLAAAGVLLALDGDALPEIVASSADAGTITVLQVDP